MLAASLLKASNGTSNRLLCSFIPNGLNFFSTTSTSSLSTEDIPFQNFRISPAEKTIKHEKFISPRKRANKIMSEITSASMEAMHNSKVHDVRFRVGDAIELHMVAQGGINSNQTEKIRGVVLGIDKRQLGTGIYLRDVVFGEPIDRKIPLYSPLIKSITVLEENFVFKKKRKVKRAKLYYLRDRLPQETRVTKW
jgi:large subunit ribosomal protein L19